MNQALSDNKDRCFLSDINQTETSVFFYTQMSIIAIASAKEVEEQKMMRIDYDPSDEVQKVTSNVNRDYTLAINLRSKTSREFNDLGLIDRQSEDQMAYNAYTGQKDETDDEGWKAQTVRPVTRNKVISIAARVTAVLISPHVFAQNDKDEEDRKSGRVMEDLMEWANDQAGYEDTFLKAVLAMLINPAVCVHTGYQEIKREVKEIKADGSWGKPKKIVDEELSGFRDLVVPIDEIYLGNLYIQNIQKQPFLVWERDIDWTTAKMKYGNLPNFKFVRPGKTTVFVEEFQGFYEHQNEDLNDRLVKETIYFNKNEDLELVWLNGILVTKPDRPMQRQDKRYPFIWGGYEFIDEGQFAYFKSLVFKLANEQAVVDEMYNMTMDGTFLALMPTTAIFGEEMIDSGVIQPGNTVVFEDPNTKMETFGPKSDLTSGYNALQSIEASMAEGSQSSFSAGIPLSGERTKFELEQTTANARTQLGLFGKQVARLVKDWGKLRMGDIVQHMTVADATKVSVEGALAFRSFLLGDKIIDGKRKSKKIEFSLDVPENERPEDEALIDELKLLERAVKNNQEISRVNPKLFRDLKFTVRVEPDVLFEPSGALKQAMDLQFYDRAVVHPLADQEAVFGDLLVGTFRPGEADKFMKEAPPPQELQQGQAAGGIGGASQGATANTADALTPDNVSQPQPA